MIIKKIILISIMTGLLLFNFGLINSSQIVFAQASAKTPETIEDVKEIGEKALEAAEKELPGTLEKIWKEEVLPVWKKMWTWFNAKIWSKVWPIAEEEIEKRKPGIEEEFGKEKEEMKQEIPKVSKSLWEKFKELIE